MLYTRSTQARRSGDLPIVFYPQGLKSIVQLHLEISSRCNAACPQCPRNFYGYPFNDGYIEKDLSLAEAKKIFSVEFVQQLKQLLINGNFGDIVMNTESLDILKYFREHNKNLYIIITTNGGARDKSFWQGLAQLDCELWFCLDGIDNHTHALYRQNTVYNVVLKNAQTFMSAGGRAVWKMIKFDHNQHQIETARQLSQQLGFERFDLIDHQRDVGPVYNNNGELVHVMKPAKWQDMNLPTEFSEALKFRQNTVVETDSIEFESKPKIHCKVSNNKTKSLYVSSTGHVYPCCWLGMAPETYGHGCFVEGANKQLRPLISENNALEYSLEHCIQWFEKVKESWTKKSVKDGNLIHCNINCGCD
jgi:MoaA/NifB/PqqE/SkfB family radical SAM enzyme